ncbi:MAG: hypothetical protein K6T28_05000 [Acidothermus sp.]|nr:hypothetical protein [Acidothermus sp.]
MPNRIRLLRNRARRWLVAVLVVVAASVAGCSGPFESSVPTPVPSAAVGQLRVFAEPDAGLAPVYEAIRRARVSIDATLYELTDPTTIVLLGDAARRGVAVRVLLDVNRERRANAAAYDDLRAAGVVARWADRRYAATHEKTIIVDRRVALVMTMNLVRGDYAHTRDFVVFDAGPADVAATEAVFDADFAGTSIRPAPGTDLVWSPGARPILLDLIRSARSSLLVENEEMALPAVVDALRDAAHRGVEVTVVMTAQRSWYDEFTELTRAGVRVRIAPSWRYIHAKAIVVDAAKAIAVDAQTMGRVFVGSQNFSATSLDRNRELGILTSDPQVVAAVAAALQADAAVSRSWHP